MKKILAALLTMAMLLSAAPMNVFAEEANASEETQEEESNTKEESNEDAGEESKEEPKEDPTEAPKEDPTEAPKEDPTEAPKEDPTEAPAEDPTKAPDEDPTEVPIEDPTEAPEEKPTQAPTDTPQEETTPEPETQEPTAEPSVEPSPLPTEEAPELHEIKAEITETDFEKGELAVKYTVDGEEVTSNITYEWKREGEKEAVSVSDTYECTIDDVNKTLVCTVTDPEKGTTEAETKVYQITASVDDEKAGSITPSGDLYAIEGSTLPFKYKVESKEGHEVEKVIIDKEEVELSDEYSFENIKKNHSLKVYFTTVTYTVKWMNSDKKTVLETDENVAYGTKPEFNGGKTGRPVYPGEKEDGYIYVFNSWDPEVTELTGDNSEHVVYTATYKKYKTAKNYNLLAVHYMAYDGKGGVEELKNAFYYTVKKECDVVESSKYKKEFANYSYIGSSMPSLVISSDKRDPWSLEKNNIYLYYMKKDAAYKTDKASAKLDASGSILAGTGIKCDYSVKSGEAKDPKKIWYSIDSDGNLKKVDTGDYHDTTASEGGKWLLCEVIDSGDARGAFSNAVFVRGEDSTLTIEEDDLDDGRLTAVYTPAENTVTGELTYEWKRLENEGDTEGEVIGSAETYTLKAEDVGKVIYCKVTDEEGTSGSAVKTAKIFSIETSVNDANMGSIKPDGTVYVAEGSEPVFTITANGDNYAADILIDDVSVEAESYDQYTFEPVAASHKMHVAFGPVVVTWKNSDGTILAADNMNPKTDAAVIPEYTGATPVYPNTVPDDKIYYPSSWKPVRKTVAETGDVTYTASYLSYPTTKYALVAVHYMLYDGNGTVTEQKNCFTYEVEELGTTVKASDYENKHSFEGYTFVGASASELTVETDEHLPGDVKKNTLYLYYMPEDAAYTGSAKLSETGKILWGTELTCILKSANGGEEYTWYSVDEDGTFRKVGSGAAYKTQESDRGKWILCEVKGSKLSNSALVGGVYVRDDSSTVTVTESDFAAGTLKASYTAIEGSASGDLTYEWIRRDNSGKESTVGTEETYTLTAADADKTIICKVIDTTGTSGSAETAVQIYTITASVDDDTKGSIAPSGTVYAIEGSKPVFTVTPVDSYKVVKFILDETEIEAANEYTFAALTASHTLVAVLDANTLTVEWVNYNCSSQNPVKETLLVDSGLTSGTVPQYTGAKPVYTEQTEVPSEYVYVFSGWDPSPAAITEDQTYLTKYVRYPSASYALIAVHYMAYNENGKATELEDQFTYDAKQINLSINVPTSDYVKTITGYTYYKASEKTVTIKSDENRVQNLKNNILYLYYLPVDGLAKLNTSETTVTSGTELVCTYSGTSPDTSVYTWYVVDDDGNRVKAATGDTYTPSSDDAGKRVYCEVTSADGTVSNTSMVTVRDANSTVTIAQANTAAKTVTATYTPAAGSTAGTLTYIWYRRVDSTSGSKEVQIGTGPSYTLQSDDVDHLIFCQVTDTNGTSVGGKSDYKRVYRITAAKSGNGSIYPVSGQYYVLEGGTLKFTFTPLTSSYKISAVTVDGSSVSTASSYTFSDISKSSNLKVEFTYIYSSSGGTATDGDGSEDESDEALGDETDENANSNGILYPDAAMADIPEEYAEAAQNPGTVEKVTYTSADGASYYALVYVPAGYDENTQYNILYLLHGENETPETILGTAEAPSTLKNTLDRMIESGMIAPMLVAAPSLYPDGYDPATTTVEELVEAFPDNWSTCVIPAVETKYSTYAGKQTEEDKLVASRDHRAFGGYGAGAAATWYAFMNDLRYTSTFLPISEDCWLLGRNNELDVHVSEETIAANFAAEDNSDITDTDTENTGAEDTDEQVDSTYGADEDSTLQVIPAVNTNNYSEEVKSRYSTLATSLSTALFNTDYWTEDFFIYAMTGSLDEAGERETALIAAMREMDESPFIFSGERTYGNVSYRVKENAVYDSSLLGMYLYNTLQNMWPLVTEETTDETAGISEDGMNDTDETDDGSFEDEEAEYDEDIEYPEDAEPVEDIDGLLDNLPTV